MAAENPLEAAKAAAHEAWRYVQCKGWTPQEEAAYIGQAYMEAYLDAKAEAAESDTEKLAHELGAIARRIERQLDLHKDERQKVGMSTDDETPLEQPFEPSHGMLEHWMRVCREAGAVLGSDGK
jgi:hypothetical protein